MLVSISTFEQITVDCFLSLLFSDPKHILKIFVSALNANCHVVQPVQAMSQFKQQHCCVSQSCRSCDILTETRHSMILEKGLEKPGSNTHSARKCSVYPWHNHSLFLSMTYLNKVVVRTKKEKLCLPPKILVKCNNGFWWQHCCWGNVWNRLCAEKGSSYTTLVWRWNIQCGTGVRLECPLHLVQNSCKLSRCFAWPALRSTVFMQWVEGHKLYNCKNKMLF